MIGYHMTFDQVADMTLPQFLIARRGESVVEEHRKLCDMIDKGLSVTEPGAVILSDPAAISAYMANYKSARKD